jgi:hypothetical protein
MVDGMIAIILCIIMVMCVRAMLDFAMFVSDDLSSNVPSTSRSVTTTWSPTRYMPNYY